MLRLIEGGFSSGSFDLLKKRIGECVKRGTKSYLIVPEQQTVLAERMMADELPASAPLSFEVTNFTRFANTVFRSLGGLCAKYCDNAKKKVLIYRALTESAPLLSTEKREISVGACEKYLAAIKEMESLGITAGELSLAASNESIKDNARLITKLSDLSIVMMTYKKLLCEKYQDNAGEIDTVIEKLKRSPDFLSDTEFFIDGFTSFTNGQERLISLLLGHCDITVTLILPKARHDALEYTETRRTHDALTRAAARAGCEVKLERIESYGDTRDLFLRELSDNLWQYSSVFDNYGLHNADILRIFSAPTPYAECDLLCADIKKRIMEGARFSDFAIVARDAKRYAGVLDPSLEKYGLSAFTSYKKDLESYAAIKLIFAAYAVISSGFRREEVIEYARCGFTGIERERIDEFESYVEKWRLDKNRFLDPTPWLMNPRGYESFVTDTDSALLLRIGETRERLLSPLISLSENTKEAKCVLDHAKALFSFISEIGLEGAIAHRAKKLSDAKRTTDAAEEMRLFELICRSLEDLTEVAADLTATAQSFSTLLKIMLSGNDLGSIPAHVDEIIVGSADMLRLYEKPHVYFIGVNDGEFPRTATSSSYFKDADRASMASIGLGIMPEDDLPLARELFCFSRALSFATSSVTLLYSEASEGYKAQRPSDVIARLISATEGRLSVRRVGELSLDTLIYSAESALEYSSEFDRSKAEAIRATLSECGASERIAISERDISNTDLALTEDLTDKIYGEKMSLTQTKLDDYRDCPLKYFCRYNLSLSDDAPAEFGARSVGTFIHAILENFFAELKRKNQKISELSLEDRRTLAERAATEYLSTLGDGIKEGGELMQIRISRLCRAAAPVIDGLCDEFSDCEFTPTLFELKIKKDRPGLPSPTEITLDDRTKVELGGTIDRVDTLSKDGDVYVRVVDYKTGYKDFTPEDLDNGENLQMFLYLKAITESDSRDFKERLGVGEDGKILPAGVVYVKTSIADVRVKRYDDKEAEDKVKDAQSRQGMILDDPEIIAKMNAKYLPVKFKNGQIEEKYKKMLFSTDGWNEIMTKVERAVKEISSKIRKGGIEAHPKKHDSRGTRCDSCSYKPICRRSSYK